MRIRLVAAAALLIGAGAALAQEPSTYRPQPTPWGAPDLQGVWTMRTLTPFERPQGVADLVVSADEEPAIIAAVMEQRVAAERFDPGTSVPDGTALAVVRGERRTSAIIDPPNGQLPLTQAGRLRLSQRPDGIDGPEARPPNERCIADAGRAPYRVMSGEMYFQIVQTAGYVVIHKEGMDPPRIFHTGAGHSPIAASSWSGSSAARWEGAVLTIETDNFRPDDTNRRISGPRAAGIPISPATRITERLERVSDDQIVYRYTVRDETLFTQPVTVELALVRSTERLYESACHEGNSGFVNILRGAREKERRARAMAGEH